ncbi:hypothetical protein AcV5_008340 [Taiwanofungus camphoratus]|nr:hypothetical protein AcV5_008340 [Antrodia cinnamomea]KAI0955758.1 hypothetical protein AcV7_006337 [Antrodia cinnamomea]
MASLTPASTPEEAKLVLVMCPIGFGKTTFINKASNSDLVVGHDLGLCTKSVQIAKYNTRRTAKDLHRTGQTLVGVMFMYWTSNNRVGGNPTVAQNMRIECHGKCRNCHQYVGEALR